MKKQTDKHGKQILRIVFVIVLVIAMILLYCIGSFAYVFALTERNGVELQGTGAAIYVDESNSYLWDYQGDKQYNPASTTKLLTCLIAAEQLNMDDKVTVTKDALKVTETNLYLMEGEKITVRDLMYLALLESHNEAAKMLSIAVSGSEKKFARLMNQKANEIGCTNSKFNNSTGLGKNRNYASAKDLCLICEAAMDNEIVKEICGKAKYTIKSTNKHEKKTLKNTNLFLKGGSYMLLNGTKRKVKAISEVYGGKTGTTEKYKTTMCVACEINGVNVFITILNSSISSRYSDIRRLIEYAKKNIQPYTAVEKGTVFAGKAKVKGGSVNRVQAEAADDGIINLPEGASPALVMVEPVYNEEITAPVKRGDVIGRAVIYLADEEVTSVDIIASEDVPEGWVFSKIGLTNLQSLIIMIVLGLILVFFIFVTTMRRINKAKAKARRQARIKEIAQKQMDRERDVSERNWPYM